MNELNRCDYLNLNTQNAESMNLNCVQDYGSGVDKYCASEYKLYDNIAINSENINIKRGVGAGYGINNNDTFSDQKIKKINESSGIEGFTGKMFITDNGPGKSMVPVGECPQGFYWCGKTNACVQVCAGCKTKGMKSQEFNEYDKCFPEGVYDGITKDGEIKCTCGKNNQYCSNDLIENVFSVIGLI